MNLLELHRFSRKSLRGGYAAALRTAWLVSGLWLLFHLVPAGLGMLLLVRGSMQLQAFWHGSTPWMSFWLLWTLFCAGVMLPVRCGVWNWFGTMLGLSPRQKCFASHRAYLRAACVTGCADGLRLLAAFPVAAAGYLARFALRMAQQPEQGALWLFVAVQALVAMAWCGWYALRLRVSFAVLPLLLLRSPEQSAGALLRQAVRMMEGHHRALWALWLSYVPAMLPVVTIPLLLPCMYTDTALFWQVRIREWERDTGKEKEQCPT